MWGEFDVPDTTCTRDERGFLDKIRDDALMLTETHSGEIEMLVAAAKGTKLPRVDGSDTESRAPMLPSFCETQVSQQACKLSELLGALHAKHADVKTVTETISVDASLVIGFNHTWGYAVSQVEAADGQLAGTTPRRVCGEIKSSAFTVGLAAGASGAGEFGAWYVPIKDMPGWAHSVQMGVDVGAGVGIAWHFAEDGSPLGVTHSASYGVGLELVEYNRGETWLGSQVSCKTLRPLEPQPTVADLWTPVSDP